MQSTLTSPPIQRRLVVVRHAKAVDDHDGGDHARPLNERGKADAVALGQWLVEHGIQPDLVLCSTAARTRETLNGTGLYAPTILSDKLYLAMPGEILAQIQSVEPAVHTLMVIGHNPGMHALLGTLVGTFDNEADADRLMLKFPTAACAVLEMTTDQWRAVAPACARLKYLRINK